MYVEILRTGEGEREEKKIKNLDKKFAGLKKAITFASAFTARYFEKFRRSGNK